MSDEGEKVCPLCTEEMDLTDQQLKPCRCGYQICVWCWHHIMDMAEKDATEGRCPACRTPYDKEKIVGMASSCERLVAEINSERKLKSQKAKSKTNDGRKHLSSVRVIQRNLVYIIGIPSNLADEDVLQHREYFGQYGKVLKVSISRTAGGAIQHSANNTCSVYITYSKEEEAVRCIQSVHGYVLDGKSLRACFGTTKYCHAWLRNMSCSNPDCLYLHDIGTQEDSFSKDEIVSAFTRSRVQQITGATNNLQRRSGMVLPPPCDDFSYQETTSVAKPISKSVQNNPATQSKGSPPDGSSGRSITLPAAASWGLRVSNGRPPTADGPAKQKPDTCNGLFSSVVASSSQTSTLHTDVAKKSVITEESHIQHPNDRLDSSESSQQYIVTDCRTTVSDAPSKVVRTAPSVVTSSNQLSGSPTSRDSEMGSSLPPDRQTCASDKDDNVATNGTLHSLCSGLESIDVNNDFGAEHSDATKPSDTDHNFLSFKSNGNQGMQQYFGAEHSDATKPSDTDHNFLSFKSNGNQGMQQYYTEHVREPPTSLASRRASNSDSVFVSREQSDWILETPTQTTMDAYSELEDGVLSFDERRLKVSEVTPSYLFQSPNSFKAANHSGHAFQHGDACSSSGLGYSDPVTLHTKVDTDLLPFKHSDAFTSNGFFQNKISSSVELGNSSGELGMSSKYSNYSSNTEEGKYLGRFSNDAAIVDMGESSIISDILSLDNDVWDNSLTSPHNLAKLLNETDKQQGSFKISNSWKAQNSNQSRFSFARQEDFPNQGSDLQPSFSNTGLVTHNCSDPRDFMGNRDPYLDRLRNGFSSSFLEEPETFPGNQFPISSDRFSVSRAQISAPPGFSLPSRTPPPGFSSQERIDQPFDTISGHHLLESSSLLRNQYQAQAAQPSGNIGDVEFIDPAILAVGKGRRPSAMNNLGYDMRSTFSSQLNGHESDPRLQLLLQQSISSHQNLRYPDHIGDRFSPLADAYRNPSRFPEQTQINNLSPFGQLSLQQQSSRNAHVSNGHWDSWNEVQNGNELSMAELLRNERLGFNKHYPSYEDLKYRMPSSGDMYNRAFGM